MKKCKECKDFGWIPVMRMISGRKVKSIRHCRLCDKGEFFKVSMAKEGIS